MLFESLSLLISTLVISIQSADSIEEQSLVQRLFTYDIVWTFLLNMATFFLKAILYVCRHFMGCNLSISLNTIEFYCILALQTDLKFYIGFL